MSGVIHSGFDFVNGAVGEVDRRGAVTSLIRLGFLERGPREAEVLQCRVHVRLRSGGAACDEPGGENNNNHEKGWDDKSTRHDFFLLRSFARLDAAGPSALTGFRYPIEP
jgi:hypothetical protein